MDFSNFIQNKDKKYDIDLSKIKRGVMVRVVYKENSEYNSYKSYLGEIISYHKQKQKARVFLHATMNYRIIELELDHLELLD